MRKYAPDDLQFVIEDITAGDHSAAGVAWHVECGDGVFFPFSRGCSFVRLNGEGKIVSVRVGGGVSCCLVRGETERAQRKHAPKGGGPDRTSKPDFKSPAGSTGGSPPRAGRPPTARPVRCGTWWSRPPSRATARSSCSAP